MGVGKETIITLCLSDSASGRFHIWLHVWLLQLWCTALSFCTMAWLRSTSTTTPGKLCRDLKPKRARLQLTGKRVPETSGEQCQRLVFGDWFGWGIENVNQYILFTQLKYVWPLSDRLEIKTNQSLDDGKVRLRWGPWSVQAQQVVTHRRIEIFKTSSHLSYVM